MVNILAPVVTKAHTYVKVANFPGLYRHARTGRYYACKKLNGIRRERSLAEGVSTAPVLVASTALGQEAYAVMITPDMPGSAQCIQARTAKPFSWKAKIEEGGVKRSLLHLPQNFGAVSPAMTS